MHSCYSTQYWQLLKSEKITSGSGSITPAPLIPHCSLTFHSSASSTWMPPINAICQLHYFKLFFGIWSKAYKITASFCYQKEVSAQSVFTGKRYATLKYLPRTVKLFTFRSGNMFSH